MRQFTRKTLIVITPHSVVDVITNSSSELFIFDKPTDIVKSMIQSIYPNYLDEYHGVRDIEHISIDELNTYLFYNCYCWRIKDKSKLIPLPGYTIDEIYTWQDKSEWTSAGYEFTLMVTEENFKEVIDRIDPERKMQFLFSIAENPNWDMQEQLEEIGTRYHLG